MEKVYILGSGAISPQKTWDDKSFFDFHPTCEYSDRLSCDEPDYGQFIDVKHLRRMSRILKMGTAASLIALRKADVTVPDGIITGTAYGCLEDTGLFMRKILDQHEHALSPTPFIQSTHNTIGSQIALLLQCQGYNQTYSQDGLSFEASLLDAFLCLQENGNQVILTGGVDEITDVSHDIQKRFGIYRKSSGLHLFDSAEAGTVHGEGAFYFALSGVPGKNTTVRIVSMTTFINPTREKLSGGILQFLHAASIMPEDVDLLLLGKKGDIESDMAMEEIVKESLPSVTVGLFKHLSGEFPTSTAFALWLAAKILETQKIPAAVSEAVKKMPLRNILIYNSWFGVSHSLILLQAC